MKKQDRKQTEEEEDIKKAVLTNKLCTQFHTWERRIVFISFFEREDFPCMPAELL